MAENEDLLKTVTVTSDEFGVLEYYRQHRGEDIAVHVPPVDAPGELSYGLLEEQQSKGMDVMTEPKNDLIEREKMLSRLAIAISVHERVPVSEITPEFVEALVKEQRKVVAEKNRKRNERGAGPSP